MKRVLIFSLAYYPHVGGAEVALKALTDRMPDIEWHMLTLRFGDESAEERVGNVLVHRVGGSTSYLSKIFFVLRAAFAARALHKRFKFDALWAMMSYMALPIVIAQLRIPYVLTLQDGDPFERVYRRWFIVPFLPFLRSGFKNAARVTVLSNYLAGWARRMGHPKPPVVVPNGADIEYFGGAEARDIGRGEGETWLVTSSRLVHKNAVDDVIRALALLPSTVHFLVLGSGPEEGGLKALARDLGVIDRVHFVGFVSHTELPSYLHASDIFVRPSRTEGFGASFPEAMAVGLPVVATQVGGISDFLFDEKRNPDKSATGWAVDVEAPAQIASAVKEIMTNPAKVERVRENAFNLVREKYSWDTVALQMRSVFGTLGV